MSCDLSKQQRGLEGDDLMNMAKGWRKVGCVATASGLELFNPRPLGLALRSDWLDSLLPLKSTLDRFGDFRDRTISLLLHLSISILIGEHV